jgi:predicted SAM-dependent methyltransferase
MYELNFPTAACVPGGDVEREVIDGSVAARAFLARTPLRLHLGCGTVRLDGWVNVDRDGGPDLRLDLRFGLPFPDASVDRIHSEHMVEHLRLADAQLLMKEAFRVLRPGGVMRLGMPDLDTALSRYSAGDWRDQPWIQDRAFNWIDSPVAFLNVAFRGWEHQYLYDEGELRLRLGLAGFAQLQRVHSGESSYPDLRGLETRPETDLIVEALR